MKRAVISVMSVFMLSLMMILAGCSTGTTMTTGNSPAIPRTMGDDSPSADAFSFAIISDLHGAGREGIFPMAVEELNLMAPRFVMSVGDLIPGYIEDVDGIHAQWDAFDAEAADLEMPFYYVPGNHDITNPVMAEVWQTRRGASYYHFTYNNVLFVCLNTEDTAASTISEAQVDCVRKALAANPDVRWTLVFMHKPLWDSKNPSGFAAIEELLAGRAYTVFAGHYHSYCMYRRKGMKYFILSTTGGGSQLRGDVYGEFDHFVWVTMTDAGPKIANVMLDGVKREDVTTEAMDRLVYGVLHGGVASPAVLIEDELFKEATTCVRLTNPSDRPVAYSGHVDCDGPIRVRPSELAVTLEPGASTEVPLELTVAEPVAPEAVGTIVLNWQAVADLPGRSDPITLPGSTPLCIERMGQCKAAAAAVTIDGKLDEWPALDAEANVPPAEYAKAWSGPEDASFRFGACYDDAYLYVAVRAADDRVAASPANQYWTQDAVELWVDVRDAERRNQSPPNNPGDRRVCGISPGCKPTNAPEGFLAAASLCEGGYEAEFAVPLSYLRERQGGDWQGFRLNLVQFDRDDANDDYLQLWWRPSWRGSASALGSGTFLRR